MPWLHDDFSMKEQHAIPGLSLVQWMNMQQNPSLTHITQPNYLHSLSGSALQNLAAGNPTGQLGLPGQQISLQNNIQFNSQMPGQYMQQLDQKVQTATLNSSGSIMQQQQQLTDSVQQQRQSFINQAPLTSHFQGQLLQTQTVLQSHNQLQRNLPQNLIPQQQQHSKMTSHHPDPINQQLQIPENQTQIQLLKKLQQQHQLVLAQQSTLQQPSQVSQLQDSDKQPLDISNSVSGSIATSQMHDVSRSTSVSLPSSNANQQSTRTNSQTNLQFSRTSQQPAMLAQFAAQVGHTVPLLMNQLSATDNGLLTGSMGGQSVLTDDLPSCSASPSMNNCPNGHQAVMNGRTQGITVVGKDISQSSATLLSSCGLEAMSASSNLVKNLRPKSDAETSSIISKNQNQGFLAPQVYKNSSVPQMENLDSSTSVTSVCLSQDDQSINPTSLSSQPIVCTDMNHHEEAQDAQRNNMSFGINIDYQLGMPMTPDPLIPKSLAGSEKDYSNYLSSGGMLYNYEDPKEGHPELLSSMVSQSFGVPDMAFNSISSTIDDSSFIDRGTWAPKPPMPRMRTYTKVG